MDWWRMSADSLRGRAFVDLFFFAAPAGSDATAANEAWALLEAASASGELKLQARVEGAGFEARVRLSRQSSAEAVSPNAGAIAFIAEVQRTVDPTEAEQPQEDLDLPTIADEPELKTSEAAVEETAATFADSIAALRRRTAEYRQAEAPAPWSELEGSGVGLFELDFIARTARFSAVWAGLLGYELDDVGDEPETLSALFHPDDSEAAPRSETRGLAGSRVPYSAEARLRTKDGSWRWMQLEGVQSFADDGSLARITGVMLDAQEQHEAEDELLRNEERFRRLLGHGNLGFFELDFAEDTASFSADFRRALGYTAKELPNTPDGFLDRLSPEDAEPGGAAFFASLLNGRIGLTCRYQLEHKDGRRLTFEGLIAAERNRRGEIERVIGVQSAVEPDADEAEDSREPARPDPAIAEAALLNARQALDAVAEAVLLTDLEGRVIHVNTRAIQMAGGDPDKVEGALVDDVFPLFERSTGDPALQVVQRVIKGGQALELDHRYATVEPDGAHSDVVLTIKPLFDARNRTSGAIVILRKPAEMPLSPAELVASNRMETLGRLACGIAHDFNNVLTTVTGSISLAQEKRAWEPLAPAQKALETARNLARQLLTFARGRSAERKVQSINDVIKETARLTGAGSRTAIMLELTEVYPVNVDSVQFVQVFTNLILNAMQVMPDGGKIWIRSLNIPLGQVNSVDLPPGDYVRIDVQDNGPGILQDHLDHIFEPFFSTRSGGTGLGLAMVRSIVAQHEGAIEATSTPGSGTVFTIYLPRALQEAPKELPKPMSVSYGTGRILLMDDDPDLCVIAKGMLEVLGYEADTASSAADAIATFARFREMGQHYAAVILDLTMAGGPGGEEVLVSLREIDPSVKVIVSSGYATDEQAERYAQQGFNGVLAKPYRSADLGRVLKEVLGKSTAS